MKYRLSLLPWHRLQCLSMATVKLFWPQLGLPYSKNNWLQWHTTYSDTFGQSHGCHCKQRSLYQHSISFWQTERNCVGGGIENGGEAKKGEGKMKMSVANFSFRVSKLCRHLVLKPILGGVESKPDSHSRRKFFFTCTSSDIAEFYLCYDNIDAYLLSSPVSENYLEKITMLNWLSISKFHLLVS